MTPAHGLICCAAVAATAALPPANVENAGSVFPNLAAGLAKWTCPTQLLIGGAR